NLAEDQQRTRVLRQRESAGVLNESIQAAVCDLQQRALSASEVRALLDKICIRLVLTAHPSEAKRKEVLVKLRRIGLVLSQKDRQALLPREEGALEDAIAEEIEELWQTRSTRATRATVADEVDFGLYFITDIIMDVAVDIYDDLQAALEQYYPDEDWSTLP